MEEQEATGILESLLVELRVRNGVLEADLTQALSGDGLPVTIGYLMDAWGSFSGWHF